MKTNEQVKRSRRLRKKLYVDEYSVLGFEFHLDLKILMKVVLMHFLTVSAVLLSREISLWEGLAVLIPLLFISVHLIVTALQPKKTAALFRHG